MSLPMGDQFLFVDYCYFVHDVYVLNDINKVKPTADSRLSASFKIASQPDKEDVCLRNNDYFYKSSLVALVHPDPALFAHVFLVRTAAEARDLRAIVGLPPPQKYRVDRKSTRLNSSHVKISYAVFCLKKKIK